ncbi:MAG: hypothetical protein CME62_00035 [Halobacteriovoraceae bacterium]|nr:hypothetical protein [Halobacteriovoraceae bacterium]|tara:strand:- start:7512 stop:8057 length:546 start_codon:yes stop_codon:yes gene_type:complete
MKSWKFKILAPLIFVGLLFIVKYILWDFPVSDGKRVGNLTKISHKGRFIKTWEGTIDEGSGDQLTTRFSVKSDQIGEELYAFEGKGVVIYYNEHLVGWPRETKYDVVSWKPQQKDAGSQPVESNLTGNLSETNPLVKALSKTLFCSLLGTLYKNQELYQQVKDYVRENNLYLYNQYENCND